MMARGGGMAADILWIAQIQDQTYQFFQDWAARMDQMHRQTLAAMDDIGGSIDDVGWQIEDLADIMQQTGSRSAASLGVVAGATSAVTKALIRMGREALQAFAGFAKESANLAAHAETLSAILNVIGQNAGYSTQELAKWERQMNENGITIRATRQILAEMVQQNLDLTKAVDLSRVAQDAGRIAMINSSEAAHRLVHGIATLNPLVLRHMGIIVDFEQAYRNAANQMDRNWESFTIAEKQTIALNEALRVGARIAGAYEAATATVGGQLMTMARLVEDLQVTFGRLFQPAYSVFVQAMSDSLEDARDWLEENEDAVTRLAERLRGAAEAAMEFGSLAVEAFEAAGKAASTLGDVIVGLGSALAVVLDESVREDLEQRVQNLGRTAAQAVTLVATAIGVAIKSVVEFVTLGSDLVQAFFTDIGRMIRTKRWKATKEELADNEPLMRFLEGMRDLESEIRDTADSIFLSMAKATGAIDTLPDSAEEAAGAMEDAMGKIAKDTEDAVQAISKLNKEFEEAFAEMALERAREEFDEQVRLFRRLQDLQRKHLQRLEDIRRDHARKRADVLEDQADEERELAEDAADRRADLDEEYAEKRAEIWREYFRELEDIQRHYLEDVEEAARQNDAVQVARLMRQRARDRRDAKIERDRDLQDTERDYQKELSELEDFLRERKKKLREDAKDRLQDLEETLAEQLEDARIARERELEELDIYQTRRMEDLATQHKRELDDLRQKHKDELSELGKHLASLETLNETAMRHLLSIHGAFIKDDTDLWESYYSTLRDIQYRGTYGSYGQYRPPGTPEAEEYRDPNTGRYVPSPPISVPQPRPQPQPQPRQPVRGSPYDPPANIVAHCKAHPDDPVCAWYGITSGNNGGVSSSRLQSGGLGLAMNQQTITVGEVPEIVAAVPLGRSMTHNIRMSGDLNVNGVSPSMERDLKGEMLGILQQFGEALLASGVR